MSKFRLTETRLTNGVWHGVLDDGGTPEFRPDIKAIYREEVLEGLEIKATAEGGRWDIRLPVPPKVLSEGVHTVVFQEAGSETALAHFTVIAGETLADDIRAEMDLLRAELDMLKQAFRRHCTETA